MDAENAVKACNIGQDGTTSGGSPQRVRGGEKVSWRWDICRPRNNKEIGMGVGCEEEEGGGDRLRKSSLAKSRDAKEEECR